MNEENPSYLPLENFIYLLRLIIITFKEKQFDVFFFSSLILIFFNLIFFSFFLSGHLNSCERIAEDKSDTTIDYSQTIQIIPEYKNTNSKQVSFYFKTCSFCNNFCNNFFCNNFCLRFVFLLILQIFNKINLLVHILHVNYIKRDRIIQLRFKGMILM